MNRPAFGSFCYVMQRFMSPCNIATVGYFLLPECSAEFDSSWSSLSLWALGTYCLVVFWLFIDTLGIFVLFLGSISFAHALLIFKYTMYFQKCLEVNLETKSHTTYEVFSVYRQLQLLTRYFNGLQQKAIIFVVLILGPMCVIFGAYTLIVMGSNLSLPHFTQFFLSLLDGMIVLVICFTVLSKVNTGAEDALQFVTGFVTPRISPRKSQKWVQVFVKSLKPLQVNMGSVNFVDKLTPFTLLDFSVNQIVSLLLMDKG